MNHFPCTLQYRMSSGPPGGLSIRDVKVGGLDLDMSSSATAVSELPLHGGAGTYDAILPSGLLSSTDDNLGGASDSQAAGGNVFADGNLPALPSVTPSFAGISHPSPSISQAMGGFEPQGVEDYGAPDIDFNHISPAPSVALPDERLPPRPRRDRRNVMTVGDPGKQTAFVPQPTRQRKATRYALRAAPVPKLQTRQRVEYHEDENGNMYKLIVDRGNVPPKRTRRGPPRGGWPARKALQSGLTNAAAVLGSREYSLGELGAERKRAIESCRPEVHRGVHLARVATKNSRGSFAATTPTSFLVSTQEADEFGNPAKYYCCSYKSMIMTISAKDTVGFKVTSGNAYNLVLVGGRVTVEYTVSGGPNKGKTGTEKLDTIGDTIRVSEGQNPTFTNDGTEPAVLVSTLISELWDTADNAETEM